MLQTAKESLSKTCILEGEWDFTEMKGAEVPDLSGNNHNLKLIGNPSLFSDEQGGSGVKLNGSTEWLGSKNAVVQTDKSYSIVAWVRLDSDKLNHKLALKPGEHALTAISQDSPTHSAFYLGVRNIEETQPDGKKKSALKWNFTIAPIDGSETGAIEWQHAHSQSSLGDSTLDKWVMLVGVCDVEKRSAFLYVPSLSETATAPVPSEWVYWKAKDGFQLGRGRWLGQNVDQWPGSIGTVRAFSGALTKEEARNIYLAESEMYNG